MKYLMLILSVSLIYGCRSFEKDYYERVTKIKFPEKYRIVATADNDEFLTITILDLKKEDCSKFVHNNNFLPVSEKYPPALIGLNFLDSSLRNLPDTKKLLIRQKEKLPGETGWTYLLDTTNCRLYCEVDYPDYGGN